ncbi:MAG: uroporphyrinogen-III C-methyltransferase [Alphaproteobacteria bacterium]|nr:uroporphyrinogen-III C-methyltransferase [Alphaproteobacteria bacterium]
MSETMLPAPPGLPEFLPGWVWLVGAGPGDPALLTVGALHALQQADLVIYDALVSAAVLALARGGAILEYAGKRGGKPGPKQPDISRRLIQAARREMRVLRLKGGDPFVFGRGAEEALALAGANIPFRVVPGVTAGIGGLAYAGIPLTARDTNSSVTFLTGHGVGGAVPDGIDWAAVVRASPMLVIYMALKHLPEIVARLTGAGLAGATPVAVVASATLPAMEVRVATLATVVAAAAAAGLEPPAILAVGEPVRLRAGLDWLGAIAGRALETDPLGARGARDTGS